MSRSPFTAPSPLPPAIHLTLRPNSRIMTRHAPKRAKFEANPNRDSTRLELQSLCVHCAQHTTATLGELVRHAHAKNQAMRQATDSSLSRVVRQRALWTSLRKTFFAPGVDSEALSNSPALAQHERLAYPCSCSQTCQAPQSPTLIHCTPLDAPPGTCFAPRRLAGKCSYTPRRRQHPVHSHSPRE